MSKLKKKMGEDEVTEFLRESNAIEGVHDEDSLIQAREAWEFLMSQEEMTPRVVRKVHAILMKNQEDLLPDEKGQYRTIPVFVGQKEMLPAPLIHEQIGKWCKLMNDKSPVYPWKELHVEYEHIHPFVDGNGRTGRMFMNWGRLRNRLPILTIHVGKEQKAYYKWFSK